MHLRSVGRAILRAAHPLAKFRIIVNNGERSPGDAAVVGAEQALRRCAGVPDIWLVGMRRRQPEGVIDDAPFHSIGGFDEGRGKHGFLPVAAEIGGTKNGGPQVTGFCRCQQRSPVTRVEHQMINDVTEKVWSVSSPGLARRVAVIQPRALASGDEYNHTARNVAERGGP